MSTQLAVTKDKEFALIEQVVMQGDLSKLTPQQRVTFYNKVCESLGLNPFTKPFDYINLSGKLTLYAKKDCTEQLRKLHGVSIEQLDDKLIDDVYVVTAKAKDRLGRVDQAKGAVCLGNTKGEARANLIMKAETKAKRRVTLSICGMGWTDETEVESIPNAKPVDVDFETGEIIVTPSKVTELKFENPNVKSEETSIREEMLTQDKPDVKSETATKEQVDQLLFIVSMLPKENQANFNRILFDEKGYLTPYEMTPAVYRSLTRTAKLKLEEMAKQESEEVPF